MAKYRELLGTEPNARNRDHIERRVAYRLQEIAFGGLPADVAEKLDQLANSCGKPSPQCPLDRPIRGTRFLREWKGVTYVVTATEDGFEWQGWPYASLSAVARAITGTRWNGHLFFGLRATGRARR